MGEEHEGATLYSVAALRERFEDEDLDVNTDLTATFAAEETPEGIVVRCADYPVWILLADPQHNLDDLTKRLGLIRADLADFTATVNISVYPGEDDEGNRTGIGVLVNFIGPDDDYAAHGFAQRNDGEAWSLDEAARIFGIAPDAIVWEVVDLNE